jgi:hypothetical protein
VRKALKRVAASVALIVLVGALMFGAMILYLDQCERLARAERNQVQIGMTVDDVVPLLHGGGIRAHAVLPDNVSDDQGVHYTTLVAHSDGTFGSSDAPRLTEHEAVALMKQKMSDGYEWRWRYTFINVTPQHFSFTVTFGRDGHVKDVTDVWGWD